MSKKKATPRKGGKVGKVFAWIAVGLAIILTAGLLINVFMPKREEKVEYVTQEALAEQIAALKAENAALRADMTAGDTALGNQIVTGNDALRADMTAGDDVLRGEIAAGDASLSHQMTNGDSALRNEMAAGDAVVSNKVDTSYAELEESIVWYQHDVRFTVDVKSAETGGSATAIGYCTMTIINDNPNAYDCIDIGNGSNPFVRDLAEYGSKSTSGYCLIDYRMYESGAGRKLTYLFQNTTVFNDTTEGSAYAGDHLYVFVHGVYEEGDFNAANVKSQLIPNIVVSYEPDGTPVYNGGRFILTDTAGIKTATINDNVTRIALN